MKTWRWRISSYSKIQVVVAAGLLMLLPLLALMQYRLLGKVSQAERERMRASLQVSADRFSLDFDQEVIRIYSAFLVTPSPAPSAASPDLLTSRGATRPDARATSIPDRTGQLLASAYTRWHETTAYPRLIDGVYLVRWPNGGGDEGATELLQLGLDAVPPGPGQPPGQPLVRPSATILSVSPIEWPARLTGLRRKFATRREANGNGLRPVTSLDDGHPALLFQIIDTHSGPSAAWTERDRNAPELLGFGIVTINLAYLQQEMLPSLVRQHFVDGDRQLFDMAIAPRLISEQAIWRSDADRPNTSSSPWDFRESDLSVNLFKLRSDLLRQQLRRWRPSQESPAPTPGTPRLTAVNPRAIFNDELPPLWDLHLRHYTGSLDVAVANARRTNLMISLAILSLLTASFLLMMVSSGRARRLAQEQMNFVAGVSHELRTPLAVIDSAGYNLSRGFVKRPEATREYGEMIRSECRRLGEMVEQVLDFATYRSGRQVFDYQPMLLTDIVAEAVRASQPLLDEGGFTIEQQIPSAAPGDSDFPFVMADRQAMVRALRNLLSNAMKYGGDDRWIGLRVASVRRGRQQLACLTISDHGRGIARDDLSHIFEPFYRSSDVRTAQIQGNGLGLSLVRNIVEAHQGAIQVESSPGRGTSFTISLPTASLPALEDAAALLTPTQFPTQ